MVFFYKNWRPRRSVLFMPAINRRALEKAKSLQCDAVIFDLEDSVDPNQQEIARENLLELVKGVDFGDRETIIRISEPANHAYAADIETALACQPNAVLVPKVEGAGCLRELSQQLKDIAGSKKIAIWAMIETPKAVINLKNICESTDDLECLVIGPNDLAKTTGSAMISGRGNFLPWLMEILVHGRAYGQCVLDGVYNQFKDEDGFKQECEQGRQLGFDGKTLIHPSQIEAANGYFSPSEVEIANAEAIIDAFEKPENQGKAALHINGEMFEKLHLESARQLLKMAGSYSGSE